jgi:alkanesulfonate monooxygenase SsuD/methylene tetrahydromethanopterin reductase-like flavin-dependent oxidoreductase (luciferase family)
MVGLGVLAASAIDEQVRSLSEHGMTDAEARQLLITGDPAQAAARFAELVESGADRIVGIPFTGDRFRQSELLAEAAQLVNG